MTEFTVVVMADGVPFWAGKVTKFDATRDRLTLSADRHDLSIERPEEERNG